LACIPFLARRNPEQLLGEADKVIRLRLITGGKADDSLLVADVAVANQITEERGQLLIYHFRDADRAILVLHQGKCGESSFIFTDQALKFRSGTLYPSLPAAYHGCQAGVRLPSHLFEC